MAPTRMVHLVSVASTFHARVVAARLGAEGIVTELRGSVDGPYPMGEVHVFVGDDDLDEARELLMADEIESAFDAPDEPADDRPAYELWVIVAAIVLAAALSISRAV